MEAEAEKNKKEKEKKQEMENVEISKRVPRLFRSYTGDLYTEDKHTIKSTNDCHTR